MPPFFLKTPGPKQRSRINKIEKMTHEEKITYMKIAASLVGYGFERQGLDMLVSLYELVLQKKGETDLHSIVDVELAVKARYVEIKNPRPEQVEPGAEVEAKNP